MPENARPGESFEVVATIQPSEDGSFALVALDGMNMPSEEEGEEDEEETEEPESEEMPARDDGSKITLPF